MPHTYTAGMRIVLSLLLLVQTVPVQAATFTDTADLWFRHQEAIEYLQTNDVLEGYADGTFRPNEQINRAEFLKIVFKGRSTVTPSSRDCFTDVNPDEWYAPYVCAAKNRGIVRGYADGSFKPSQIVNTAEALKIVLNAYKHDIDEASGKNWYEPYVYFLDSQDILAKHSYIPAAPLTRLAAADLIWRLIRFEEDAFVPRFSEGCGKAQRSPITTVEVNGVQHTFLLTVPNTYVIHDPVPLIFAYHGRTNDNQEVRRYYGLDKAFKNAFIVYPQASITKTGLHSYGDTEIRMFNAIAKELTTRYCIDMNQIYTVGHSLGGWFSNKIACMHGDVVRASVTVGSSGYSGKCSGPAAAMIIHNPKDDLAPISGSIQIRDQRGQINQCTGTATPVANSTLACVQYTGCSNNPVVYCPHTIDTDHNGRLYPHNWPRGTAAEIVSFFKRLQ